MADRLASTLPSILAVGALTGMRSMVGATLVATDRFPHLGRLAAFGAIGEMVVDKTPAVGDRTGFLQLAARVATGAVAGASFARRGDADPVLGGILGATAAFGAAHLASAARRRLPRVAGGVIEDAVVLAASHRVCLRTGLLR